jgi:hypothetical protein
MTHLPMHAFMMPHAQVIEAVRGLVATTFANLGLASGIEPRESILIRGGAYCGRRFEVEQGHAIWFIEAEQIKFYSADGSLIRSISSRAMPAESLRKAA